MGGWTSLIGGKELTPQQIIRRHQRSINKVIRGIDRERLNLEREEQKQASEIKRMAQKNQQDYVRTLANDLVRLRGQMKKLLKMKQNLQGVSIQLQTLGTHQSISQAVYQATLVLRGMNTRLNMPKIREILKEFEKQSQIMETKGELIGETMDEVGGFDDDGDESEEIVAQVLDELGLQIHDQLPEAPLDSKAAKKSDRAHENAPLPSKNISADDELLDRLERLRKN